MSRFSESQKPCYAEVAWWVARVISSRIRFTRATRGRRDRSSEPRNQRLNDDEHAAGARCRQRFSRITAGSVCYSASAGKRRCRSLYQENGAMPHHSATAMD